MLKTLSRKKELSFIKDVSHVFFATFFLAIFAKVHIYLFFTPVPLILQNSIAISYGYFLGLKKSSFAILLFILLGALGLPVFTNGNFGMSYLLNITGGYIFSFFFASLVVAKIFDSFKEKRYEINYSISKNNFLMKFVFQNKIFLTIFLGHIIVLLGGSLYLSLFIGIKEAILLGILPFVLGDIFKSIILCKLIQVKKAIF
jgi:biotin transport system substrate-specific component